GTQGAPTPMTEDARWEDARRVEGWAGEVRVNLVRLAAVLLFYGYHLLNVYLSRDDPALAGTYHVSVTALVMVWSVGVAALWLYLARRSVPPALKYVVTAWDTLLITTLLVLAGGPPNPPRPAAAAPPPRLARSPPGAGGVRLPARPLRLLPGRLRALLQRPRAADPTHPGGHLRPRPRRRRRPGRSGRAPGAPARGRPAGH